MFNAKLTSQLEREDSSRIILVSFAKRNKVDVNLIETS